MMTDMASSVANISVFTEDASVATASLSLGGRSLGSAEDSSDYVIIKGCGTRQANGSYRRSGSSNGAPKYKMNGVWNRKEATYRLFLTKSFSKYRWELSVSNRGYASVGDVGLYCTRPSEDQTDSPPWNGWLNKREVFGIGQGKNPSPKVYLNRPEAAPSQESCKRSKVSVVNDELALEAAKKCKQAYELLRGKSKQEIKDKIQSIKEKEDAIAKEKKELQQIKKEEKEFTRQVKDANDCLSKMQQSRN